MITIHIEKGGLFTTVQDLGRKGFQQYGMPVAGAMDELSYLIGQELVGNVTPKGALECTMMGPTFTVDGDCLIAFTGAPMAPTINGHPAPMYESIRCHKGDTISSAFASKGMRMYIAFSGGIEVPPINGSVSTHTKSKMGGFEGRALKDGDQFQLAMQDGAHLDKTRRCADATYKVEQWDMTAPYRITWGPQDDAFTDAGKHTFTSAEYEIGTASDRMGFRLQGEPIEHISSADIISDGTVFGSIQVPADGQPIVLMADRQTTGGYTKIGTVITLDLPRLAQAQIGSKVTFKAITVGEAHEVYKAHHEARQALFQEIDQDITTTISPNAKPNTSSSATSLNKGPAKALALTVNGVTYDVTIEEVK